MKPLLVLMSLLISAACSHTSGVAQHPADQPGTDTISTGYFRAVREAKLQQEQLRKLYLENGGHDSVLKKAAVLLQKTITHDFFSYWKNTYWDFYGMTDTPGRGFIACGYFVTTLLRDAGVPINRIAMAETYSELMIKTLVSKEFINKQVPFNLKQFTANLKKQGNALYLVGLDNHTGFVSVENGEVYFIHSTVVYPSCVMKEKAEESVVLQANRYMVYGCITKDPVFIKKWIGV